MSKFINAFIGNDNTKELNDIEIASALRGLINEENGAIILYQQFHDSISSEQDYIKKVITSIINEEKIHVGEFRKLLEMISPEDKKLEDSGIIEVNKITNTKPEK